MCVFLILHYSSYNNERKFCAPSLRSYAWKTVLPLWTTKISTQIRSQVYSTNLLKNMGIRPGFGRLWNLTKKNAVSGFYLEKYYFHQKQQNNACTKPHLGLDESLKTFFVASFLPNLSGLLLQRLGLSFAPLPTNLSCRRFSSAGQLPNRLYLSLRSWSSVCDR